MNNKLLIYDFDGTIGDSEPNHHKSKVILCKELGVDLTEEVSNLTVGHSAYDGFTMIKKAYNLKPSVEELIERWLPIYKELSLNTPIFPPMKELIIALHKKGYKQVIASANRVGVLDGFAERMGIKPYFNGLFSSSQVARGKPAPDLFLMTAQQMLVDPADCLVFEDSEAGVIATRDAGMACVAVPMAEQYEREIFHSYPVLTYKTAYNLNVDEVIAWLEEQK